MKAGYTMTAALALCVLASGCAGRSPNPVAVAQPFDQQLDCPAIFAQLNVDNERISDLSGDQGAKVAQNVAAGVVGLFIWPVWFGMGFQGTAGIEIRALQDRRQYLATLAQQKHCTAGYMAGAPGTPAAAAPAAVLPAVYAGPPAPAPAPIAAASAASPIAPLPAPDVAGDMGITNRYHPSWTVGGR
jgi:hypothetical protein